MNKYTFMKIDPVKRVACVLFLLLCTAMVFAQGFTVTGLVTDDTGEPLIGASVIVKGTGNGTVTDIDGRYTLNQVTPESVLGFSFVGYVAQEILVGNSRVINAQLNGSQALSEIVVTALGIARERKALAYAVSDVNADDIVASNTINPVLALQGKAAGVAISGSNGGIFGSSRIQVRGVSTLSNNTQPIFVVDGIILANDVNVGSEWSGASTNDFGNQLKNLNPDDFESVTILKGANATALYGSRGLNGAVVITTKSGAKRQGIGISVSQTVGIDHVYKGPDFQYEYGPGGAAGQDSPETGQNRYLPNFGIDEATGMHTLKRMPRGEYSGTYGPRYDGSDIIDYDGRIIPYSPNKDFFTDAFDLGWNTSTNVSISGGNDNTTFYISDTYTKRKGWSPTNEFERNSFMFKGTHKLASFLRAEGSVSFNQSTSINPPFGLANHFMRSLWKPVYDTKYYKDRWQTSHGGTPSTNYGDGNAEVPGVGTWWSINNRTEREKQTLILPVVRLVADVSDFTFAAEGNMNILYSMRDLKQLGSGYKNEGTSNGAGGQYTLRQSMAKSGTIKLSGAYSKTFGDFTAGGTVGGEWFMSQGTVSTNVGTAGGLVVPGQYFIGNSRDQQTLGGSDSGSKHIYSLYFLANVSWKNQLYLDVTGRNDWSSALVYSNGTGNYSYFYPSVGASWLFSETFDLPGWFTFGKVRASWAQVGNDTGVYSINQTYGSNNTRMPDGSLVTRNTFDRNVIDPSLRPERKNAVEAGLDLSFVDNRIGLEATYYKENTFDQIINIPAPSESGINSQRINAGNIQNQGIEIVLRTTPVKRAFQWDLNVMYAKNKNKIVELHPQTGEFMTLAGNIVNGTISSGDFRMGSVAYVGGEYGTLLSDILPRIDPATGKQVLKWNDGMSAAYPDRSMELTKVGKQDPDFTGSVTNTFSYKGIFASVLMDFRWGGYIASYTNRYAQNYGMTKNSLKNRDNAHGGMTFTSQYEKKGYATFHDGMIPDGIFGTNNTATGPDGQPHVLDGMTYQQAVDANYIEPMHGSAWTYLTYEWGTGTLDDSWFSEVKYIALRHVTLGYTIPDKLTSRLGISNLRLAVEAHNLGYLYNSLPNHLHPESTSGNSNNYMYYERVMQPYVASYNFTLRFNL